MKRSHVLVTLLALLCLGHLIGCGDDVTCPTVNVEEPVNLDPADFPVYAGSIGLVIDTRPIFQKGYAPTRAELSFPGASDFDTVLAVDALTNLAILRLENEALTEAQREIFAAGLATTIVVYGEAPEPGAAPGVEARSEVELGRREEDMILDDSNRPYAIATELPTVTGSLPFITALPYLLHAEGWAGFLTNAYPELGEEWVPLPRPYLPGDWTQLFFFEPVSGAEDTYMVRHGDYRWGWHPAGLWVYLTTDEEEASEFVIERDDRTWVKFRCSGEDDRYLWLDDHVIRVGTAAEAGRWRLLADMIDWELEDFGTAYEQPIMPPARVDFAYQTTIRNCSAAQVTETIGRTQSKTVTTTYEYVESLQLFSSEETSSEIKVSTEVELSFEAGGFGASYQAGVEASQGYNYTTSESEGWEEHWTTTLSETVEVSRDREVVVPPYTAITATDIIRSIENVRMPWTQRLRLRGRLRESGRTMTGPELLTHYHANLAGGLVMEVGEWYLDISLRGETRVDSFYQAESVVNDDESGCGG